MAPKTSEQFAEIRLQSQQKIEMAALSLFAERGYHNTSISAIAKAAGVSKGLLYNYYDSKEGLLYELVTGAMDDAGSDIEEMLRSDAPALEKLIAVTEASFDLVKTNPRYWKLMTMLSFQKDVIENIEELIRQKRDGMIQLARGLFAEIGFEHPERVAFLYGALLDGIMVHYIVLEKDYPLDEMKAYLLEKFKRAAT